MLARAVNRSFRGAKNRTRPPFVHVPFVFTDPSDELIVKYGNVQGACFYRKTRAGRNDCIVASIAGNVFAFTLVNKKFQVDKVWANNNARLLHTWFVQAADWLYIQNGLDKPIFWDGIIPSTARQSKWPDEKEMPVGTLMAYSFGRVFVADAFDQIAASDIIYGTGFTNTKNTQNFTENTYWNEGGSFGMPTNLGHITGMTVTTAQGKGNLYGQGVVMALGDNGIQVIDASVSRNLWKDSSIQSVVLSGQGCLAPASVVNVNNATMFRSDDGLSLFRNLQIDQSTQLSFAKFSQAVNNWFDDDTPSLVRYNSTIYSSNRVLSTVSPIIKANVASESWGNHRFHRGMVSLDLDRQMQQLTGKPLAWNGLWTGIRPSVLVNGKFAGIERAFAFSFDGDGQNRIYEIGPESGRNDVSEGKEVLPEWFYFTKRYDWSSAQSSNSFEMKKIVGGELHISEVKDRVEVEAFYRADYREDWFTLQKEYEFGPKMEGFTFSNSRWRTVKFLTPSNHCLKGEPQSPAHGVEHQIMIAGTGSVRVNRMRVAMAPGGNDPNTPVGQDTSKKDDPTIQYGLDGTYSNDYGYLIVPETT